MTKPIPYERQMLLNDLKQSVCDVHFVKVNGQERRLRCTLDPRYIPTAVDENYLEEQHKKEENREIIAAWDLEKNAWRSFRVTSVVYVQEVNTY